MLVTDSRCWWPIKYIEKIAKIMKKVVNIMILPTTSKISQHNKVTNITMSPTSLSPRISARFNILDDGFNVIDWTKTDSLSHDLKKLFERSFPRWPRLPKLTLREDRWSWFAVDNGKLPPNHVALLLKCEFFDMILFCIFMKIKVRI